MARLALMGWPVGTVAQLVEHLPEEQGVGGSTPPRPTIICEVIMESVIILVIGLVIGFILGRMFAGPTR